MSDRLNKNFPALKEVNIVRARGAWSKIIQFELAHRTRGTRDHVNDA
jgi:hypothetical protein